MSPQEFSVTVVRSNGSSTDPVAIGTGTDLKAGAMPREILNKSKTLTDIAVLKSGSDANESIFGGVRSGFPTVWRFQDQHELSL
jgi:hypothetical protein